MMVRMLLLQVRHLCHALRGSERPFLLLFLLQRSLVLLLELRIYLCPSRRLVALSRRGLERVRDSLRLRFAICVALTLLFALAAVVESLVISEMMRQAVAETSVIDTTDWGSKMLCACCWPASYRGGASVP